MLIAGLLLIAAALFLAFKAGADDQDRRKWDRQVADQYRDALRESQQRHPGGRDR